MDDQSSLPVPDKPSLVPSVEASPEPVLSVASQQYPASAQSATDALARATSAVEAVIAQTSQNPSARMQAIADIKATYIKEQFGVDITQ